MVTDAPSKRGAVLAYLQANPYMWVQLCRVASKGESAHRLAWFHKDWIRILNENVQALLLAPRGFLKSTIVNDYLLADILMSPDAPQHQALLICDNETRCREAATEYEMILSSKIMQDLFAGIEYRRIGDDIYLDRVGTRLRGRQVERNVRPQLPGATIGNYTVETSRVGMHIDHGWAHFDDAYVSATACSQVQQAARMHRINVGWIPMLSPNSRQAISGTRHTMIDEYGEMEAKGMPTNKSSRAAEFPDGTVLWPEVWDREALDTRRKGMTEVAYRLQYLNDPTALEGAVFRPELLEAAMVGALPVDLPMLRVMGVDMAYGGEDYTAVVEVARHGSNVYVVSGWQKRFKVYSEKYRAIEGACRGRVVITEANGPQRDVYETLRTKGLQVIAYPIRGKNKLARAVETLQPLLEQGRLKIFDPLVKRELIMFTGDETRHDDLVDATVMACWYASTYLHDSVQSGFTTLGLKRIRPPSRMKEALSGRL